MSGFTLHRHYDLWNFPEEIRENYFKYLELLCIDHYSDDCSFTYYWIDNIKYEDYFLESEKEDLQKDFDEAVKCHGLVKNYLISLGEDFQLPICLEV